MNDVKNVLETVLNSIKASLSKRIIDREIIRRERTQEGNAMEALLIQTKAEECRQIIFIVEEEFAKLTPKD